MLQVFAFEQLIINKEWISWVARKQEHNKPGIMKKNLRLLFAFFRYHVTAPYQIEP
jgi:hypothetical protein